MSTWNYIVVGGGVMGCATAYQLARKGCRVLLLEQFGIGHQQGSSHGLSRIIRYSYETEHYVRLMGAAYAAWSDLEDDADDTLVNTTGGLDIGAPDSPALRACQASMRAAGIAYEVINHTDLRARFPQFRLPEQTIGVHQLDAGILPASRCVATLAAQARRYGAEVREGVRVRRLAPDGAGALVETDAETYRADRVIVTAGSWAGALLRDIGLDLPLTVTREQVAFFKPRRPELFHHFNFPVFITYGATDHSGASFEFYGFPSFDTAAVKVARHRAGPVIDPADEETGPDAANLAQVRAFVEQTLPEAAGDLTLTETCRYTTTPDTNFILDIHPRLPQFVVGSPCSGHGFKFGALVGKILSDLAQHGATPHNIAPFTLARFGV